jgi:Zn-finger nucleic acid-binding protein
MRCMVGNVDLLLAERHGIAIDYRPKCRSLWLNRGELDKIIAKGVV